MTTARTVPVTTEMDGDELDAEDAWHLVRRHGVRRVLVESFVRFRYGDGFTNSRALALQTCLAVVPFMLAVTGLAADIDDDKPARVVAATVNAVSPGTGQDDALADALVGGSEESGRDRAGDRPALRAAVDDDRDGPGRARRQPDLRHPTRPSGAAQVRPGGGVHGAAGRARSGSASCCWSPATPSATPWSASTAGPTAMQLWWQVLRWPAGLGMLVLAIAVLFDHAPRRRQPALSWLALGSSIAVLLSMVAAGGLRRRT